jgi:HAD superfamily hydrolase (TIGR01509 family)
VADALAAVVFDVDGTLVDSERHGHRVAFNAAFAALGLAYHWDEVTYGELLLVPGSERRLDHFLAGQGLPEADRRRLVADLYADKTGRLLRMIDDGAIPARPGVTRLLRELAGAGIRLGVATAGTRSWVLHLLDRVFPDIVFQAVVTTTDVAAGKPDPECYQVALDRLGVGPGAALAVEDSAPGLASATAAGLATVVVTNDYTADHDTTAAALVLDGFGPEARVRSDPYRIRPVALLDLATLRAAHRAVPAPSRPTSSDKGARCTT